VGAVVRVPKWKSVGRVVEASGSKLRVQLGAGGLTGKGPAGLMVVTVSASETEPVPQEELERILPRGAVGAGGSVKARVEIRASGPSEPVPDQIDLRGVRLDEAMSSLETYLDGAFRSGRREARIVHGLGTGAIREGTRKLLGTLPYVKSFRDGGPGQGGAGATVVEFDRD
jgi:DNA mismatch repair protein MutS2